MLILVRKVQQSFWIEGDIWVKVLSVDRDRVKLGITAPGAIKVMRQELYEGGDPAVTANGATGGGPGAEGGTSP
jgi:carbon storage regulator CsrA